MFRGNAARNSYFQESTSLILDFLRPGTHSIKPYAYYRQKRIENDFFKCAQTLASLDGVQCSERNIRAVEKNK